MLMRFIGTSKGFPKMGQIYRIEILNFDRETNHLGITFEDLDTRSLTSKGYKDLKEFCYDWDSVR